VYADLEYVLAKTDRYEQEQNLYQHQKVFLVSHIMYIVRTTNRYPRIILVRFMVCRATKKFSKNSRKKYFNINVSMVDFMRQE